MTCSLGGGYGGGSMASLLVLMLTITGALLVIVRCGEHSSQLDMDILSSLIDNFTSVMDLDVDSELYSTVTSKFETILKSTTSEHGNPPILEMSGLLHVSLLGAYKVQSHTIKDKLSRSEMVTLQGGMIDSIAPWSSQLLQFLLEYNVVDVNNSSRLALTPLELAIKLQNLEAAEMLVHRGGTVCQSFSPLKCSNALHYAAINGNERDVQFVMSTVQTEYFRDSNQTMTASLLQSLLADTSGYDSTFPFSPLCISSIYCATGLSCTVYSYLSQHLTPDHQLLPLPPRMLHSQTCSYDDVMDGGDTTQRRWYMNPNHLSGWNSYNSFRVGKNSHCDLPRVNIYQSDFSQEFERLFVDLGIPVVIEGVTKEWLTQRSWRRQSLLEQWGHIDILVGPIPYGEIFGETFGYATIDEFVSYMDRYRLSSWTEPNHTSFKAPLYVFDSEVLKEHFIGHYYLKELIVPSFQSATQHHQFILGPAGSGAPFHFHCHAFNALVYGRKKWFLHPPANKIYSKQHPLLWYMTNYAERSDDKPIECVQRAGEVVYVPSMWSHATINLDECIGLAVELDTGNC